MLVVPAPPRGSSTTTSRAAEGYSISCGAQLLLVTTAVLGTGMRWTNFGLLRFNEVAGSVSILGPGLQWATKMFQRHCYDKQQHLHVKGPFELHLDGRVTALLLSIWWLSVSFVVLGDGAFVMRLG